LKRAVVATISALAGVGVTLATGLVPNTPAQLLGATWYGYPLAWLYRLVLAPEYYPWRLDAMSIVLDALFWILISTLAFFLVLRNRLGR
jgi:hypothetical protein